jgi:hypothetical protein
MSTKPAGLPSIKQSKQETFRLSEKRNLNILQSAQNFDSFHGEGFDDIHTRDFQRGSIGGGVGQRWQSATLTTPLTRGKFAQCSLQSEWVGRTSTDTQIEALALRNAIAKSDFDAASIRL